MRFTPIVLLLGAGLGCRSDVERRRPAPVASTTAPVTRTAEPPSNTPATTRAVRAVGTQLMHAIIRRDPRVLDMIAGGADVNDRGGDRSTPLYYAAFPRPNGRSTLPVVKALVERGADVNARCIGGFTPLHAACQGGPPDVVAYLISKGADVNAKDDVGITPLHVIAAQEGDAATRADRIAVIRCLVAHGAALNPVDSDGRTPRDRARWVREAPPPEEAFPGDPGGSSAADALLRELGGKYHADLEPAQ